MIVVIFILFDSNPDFLAADLTTTGLIAFITIEEEKERKRSQKEATEAAKPKKFRSCSQLGCRAIIDITSALLKKDNEGTWKKCKVKNCSTWTCPSHFDKLEEHEVFCRKCAQ
jgi:hypothetical protein